MTKTKHPVGVFKCSKKYMFLLTVVLGLVIAPPLFAEPPPTSGQLSFDTPNFQTAAPVFTEPTPASVFGNYAGAGKCPSGSSKTCADTGVMDNVFIEPFLKPETDIGKQIRESMGIEQTDARLSIRILRDYGHNCTLEGRMFWSGDHLEFQDEPPARGTYSKCQMQLWFKDGALTIKDPGNECAEKFCPYGNAKTLEGRRYQKSPDQLLAAYKKSATPPPASIFGRYNGTGKCAPDERKIEACNKNKITDYIVIKPSETADAHVVLEGSDCRMDADVMWLDNHLAFITERSNEPRNQYIWQFWFKDNTVVVVDVWNKHCGTNIQGAIFKRSPALPKRDTKR